MLKGIALLPVEYGIYLRNPVYLDLDSNIVKNFTYGIYAAPQQVIIYE